jgi:hypothetical protein
MTRFLFYFAITGLALAIVVHLLSVARINVSEYCPFVWVLHLGIFVVWFPTVLSLRKNEDFIEYQQSGWLNRMNPFAFFKAILKNTPIWLSVLAAGGFVYAIINFALLMTPQEGNVVVQEGTYAIVKHGTMVRKLSEQEYNYFQAKDVRVFSGHWIAFYGIAAAVIFPFRKKEEVVEDSEQ